MFYYHISIVIFAILVCYKWGDWKHWDKYYSTILFFMMGDFIYLVLFRKTMLWTYNTDILNHTLINVLIIFTVYPCTIIIFIPYYPKLIFKQVIYIFFWVVLFAVMEFISYHLGCFKYHNGWNLGWSIIFCTIMFPIQYIHYKKPLLAWCISMIKLVIFIVIFKVDILHLI
jgi:hypothetical protein